MDKEQERRKILGQVADGTMSPSEAAQRLAVLDQVPEDPTATTDARTQPSEPTTPAAGLRTVRVVGSLRQIEITGDPSVREAIAEGPHQAWRDGDLLIIETEQPDWFDRDGDDDDDTDGHDWRRGPSWGGRGRSFTFGPGWRRGIGYQGKQPPVRVRMHPDLALEAEVQAGMMTIKGVRGPISAGVDAGSLKVRDFASPIDVRVNAGSFSGSGVLDGGESRIDCNAGKVDLNLEAGSSVRIEGKAELGKVSLPGGARHVSGPKGGLSFMFGEAQSAVIGDGRGDLRVSVNVGAATIRSDA